MRFGVEALPPFMLASARYLIAAPLVFVLCAIFRLKMRPTPKELGTLAIIGILMLGIGNTSVLWAEQYIPSGLAALLVAAIPLYAALIEVILPHNEGLAVQGWIGIFVGFAGSIFLSLAGPSLCGRMTSISGIEKDGSYEKRLEAAWDYCLAQQESRCCRYRASRCG